MNLKIEYIPIGEIKPYQRNAKIHTEEQVEQIKKSIEEFGFNDPLAIWNGEIVEGHGRYLAAKELGLETLPVIRLDDLTDEQRRAYGIVHNQLTMNTGFDVDLLGLELDSLDMDLSDFGLGELDDELAALDLEGGGEEYEPREGETVKCPKCGFVFEKG